MAKMLEKTFSEWKQQHLLVDATMLYTRHKFECGDLKIQFPDNEYAVKQFKQMSSVPKQKDGTVHKA